MSESFEENLKALEEAVARLEAGDVPLAEAVEVYEKAVGRLKRCHELLERAEGRVKILTTDEDGRLTERDFDAPED